ncbi:hypothetical protein FGIG_06943 [Fasciola gigantica]|uniref:Uncharacterized protein n=1 Tax=Fasciola gigantica TaxID=46835 RepID=A0A504YV56_FASGI|nr:hypothetical protein FGIG_06943 [Fasciola gigantica]
MITTLKTITNDLGKHKSIVTVTDPTRGGTVESSGGGGRSDDVSAGKDADSLIYPEVPALLIVKPVQCKAIPGHFVLSCYRREIEFTWIPPQIPIKKAMVKFKQVSFIARMDCFF